jgi:tetratricopeptide (TPR) repeat protein
MGRMKNKIIAAAIVILIVALLAIIWINRSTADDETGFRKLTDRDYVGSESCQSCHQKEYADWQNSDHDKAMMKAGFHSIQGYFNTTFTSQGVTSRFFIKDGKYFVNTQGPDGEYHDYEVIYTFGIRPLQQYIVQFPDGRLQCLRTAWDTEKREWFDLYPDLEIEPDEWLHWSRGALNWNTMCSDCHSTNVHKNFDEETNSFSTTYSIINVSCEACHGPGKAHVDFVNSRRFDSASYNPRDHLHLTSGLTAYDQVDQCARCHAHRVQFTEAFNHEGEFMDHYVPSILRDQLYFADGQILDEVFEYSSFVQSKMYQLGVKCSDCHNPHSLELKAVGNALCAQCHSPRQYDTPDHHFHTINTEGAECVSCHMTGRIYMGNDYRRDHSFRVPRPDLSVKYSFPNACNQCHEDKSAQWAAQAVDEWYGPERTTNYADVLAMGRTRTPEAVPQLIGLVDDPSQPAIARATAVWYLDQIVAPGAVEAIIRSLKSEDHIVRHTAVSALISLPPDQKAQHLAPLLQDKIRTVRYAAANALADVPLGRLQPEFRSDFQKVLQEYQHSFAIRMDFPGGQFERGQFFDRVGQNHLAESAYLKALELDNRLNMARINLAHLYNRQGQNNKAIDLFEIVISQEPHYGLAYYSLGLLYAEENSMEDAIRNLSIAAEIERSPRIYYNLGIAYQQSNDPEMAERSYLQGLALAPDDHGIMNALSILYIQQGEQGKARQYVERLLEIYPGNPQLREMWNLVRPK